MIFAIAYTNLKPWHSPQVVGYEGLPSYQNTPYQEHPAIRSLDILGFLKGSVFLDLLRWGLGRIRNQQVRDSMTRREGAPLAGAPYDSPFDRLRASPRQSLPRAWSRGSGQSSWQASIISAALRTCDISPQAIDDVPRTCRIYRNGLCHSSERFLPLVVHVSAPLERTWNSRVYGPPGPAPRFPEAAPVASEAPAQQTRPPFQTGRTHLRPVDRAVPEIARCDSSIRVQEWPDRLPFSAPPAETDLSSTEVPSPAL